MRIFTKFFIKLFTKSVFKRRVFFLISDTVLIAFSMYLSFWMRFNGKIPDNYMKYLPYFISLALAIKLLFLSLYNLYDISWRFVDLDELIKTFKALLFGSLSLGMALYLLRTSIWLKASPFCSLISYSRLL